MRPNKGLLKKLRKADELAQEYLASEREYISLRTSYYRAIRDAYAAGYQKGLEAQSEEVIPSFEAIHRVEAKQTELPNRLITMKEVVRKLGLSRGTIWRMTTNGEFPRKIAVTGKSVRWRERDVDDWICARAQMHQ